MYGMEFRDLNTPHCVCGKDHNDLPHIVSAAFRLVEAGYIQPVQEDIANEIEDTAKQVGWVQDADSNYTIAEVVEVAFMMQDNFETVGEFGEFVRDRAVEYGWHLARDNA